LTGRFNRRLSSTAAYRRLRQAISNSTPAAQTIRWRQNRRSQPNGWSTASAAIERLLRHATPLNCDTALAEAYDEFRVTTPAERKRIIVQRLGRAE
jgi:hypothetical protein